jgi:hypothetical protein
MRPYVMCVGVALMIALLVTVASAADLDVNNMKDRERILREMRYLRPNDLIYPGDMDVAACALMVREKLHHTDDPFWGPSAYVAHSKDGSGEIRSFGTEQELWELKRCFHERGVD